MPNRIVTYQTENRRSVTPCPHGVRSLETGDVTMVGSISCSMYCECFGGPIMRTNKHAILCGFPPKRKPIVQSNHV